MNKSLVMRFIVIVSVSLVVLFGIVIPQTINADLKNSTVKLSPSTLIHNGHLTICKMDKKHLEVVKTVKMIITAYSSTPDQTDEDPFINAAGEHVQKGDIAINGLPFGTQVRIPELGPEIYTVKDRLHSRVKHPHADIWFESRAEAVNFGAKYNMLVEILES